MRTYRYSEWDGTQDIFELDKDELMDELGRNLMYDGNLSYILWKMQRQGIRDRQGRHLPGIQDLLQRLRQRRQAQLDKYNLGSVLDEIRQKLDDILKTEREGIQKRLDEARQKAEKGAPDLSPEVGQKLLKTVEDMAARNLEKLDNLPTDMGGQIRELNDYDFMDEEARQKFQELMEMLKRHALQSYARDLTQRMKDMDASSLAAMRHLSLSPEDRQALEDLMQSMLDEATQYELAKMAANLETLYPSDKLQREYPFSGEESISYTEALKLMEMLQDMDKLETQFKDAQWNRSLDEVDEEMVRELMGNEEAEELERLRNMTRVLEEAGYIRRKGNRYELTPLGIRKIGEKALRDVFAQLRKDRTGQHDIKFHGTSGEQADETKKYEFGDAFQLDLQRTIMNSLYREPLPPPVKLSPDDFEVFKSEQLTRSATVLMLDLSLSMPMRGNFQAAKQVAIALDGLIRSQYPRDSLYIVGFSSYARQLKKEDLPYMGWDEFDPYTNIQQGLSMARKLLERDRCSNKQILLVSDGEPTAHLEGGHIYFQYPPSLRTIQLTLREVKNCSKQGVVINTFMLGEGNFLNAFVTQMARINKGRIFFTSADTLGRYILVDYVSSKRRAVH